MDQDAVQAIQDLIITAPRTFQLPGRRFACRPRGRRHEPRCLDSAAAWCIRYILERFRLQLSF